MAIANSAVEIDDKIGLNLIIYSLEQL